MNVQRWISMSAACAGAAALIGCKAAPILMPPAGVVPYYVAASQPQGPRVQFVNDSLLPMNVRYWVGRRDVSAAGGVADLRTDEHMSFIAEPGDHFITQVGRPFHPTSNIDAVVWVRVDPRLIDGTSLPPAWFELSQPAPYTLQVVGEGRETLAFRRVGPGELSPLAPDLWIEGNNGPFPVHAGK